MIDSVLMGEVRSSCIECIAKNSMTKKLKIFGQTSKPDR